MPDFAYGRKCDHLVSSDMAVCPHCGAKRRGGWAKEQASKTKGSRNAAVLFVFSGVLLVTGFIWLRATLGERL